MRLVVQLFARARDLAETERLSVELPAGANVAELRSAIVEQVPELASLLAVSAVSVNHDFATVAVVLLDSDEVAIIPPVSGG